MPNKGGGQEIDMYKLCAFDMDGTFVDSLGDIAAAMNRALVKLGFVEYPTDAYKKMVGSGMTVLCKRSLPNADDATVEKLMEQANTYYIKEYHRDHYESYYDNKETFRVNIVPEILLVDNGQLIGFYFAKADDIDGKYLLLTEVEGGRITLRYECTSHGDSDSGEEEYVYIFTMEYAKSHNFEM